MTKKNQFFATLVGLLGLSVLFTGCFGRDSLADCPTVENLNVTAVNMQELSDTTFRAFIRTSWTDIPDSVTYRYTVVTTDVTTRTLIDMPVSGTELDSFLVLRNPSETTFSVSPVQADGTVCPATTKRLAIPNSGIVIIDVGANVYLNIPPAVRAMKQPLLPFLLMLLLQSREQRIMVESLFMLIIYRLLILIY